MIKYDNKNIDLRLGTGREFIKSIILNDGTIINNMQCDLKAKRPTLKQLKNHEKGEDFLNTDFLDAIDIDLNDIDLNIDFDELEQELDLDLDALNGLTIE